ncbi:hypothetical protein DKN91_23110 [Escherichia coli]|nr:hypothetical protein [Escherichia coli]EFO1767820.1 hypothetical protein [Escherichia coli]EFO1928321.1 hypothetical protein [Escherichia coli]EFO1948716.1 hypothetical protein [Escherichia coli]EFO1953825.1 hypothetical protein [Escherichia coli]
MPVSVIGVNISKTGNYTILITVSWQAAATIPPAIGSSENDVQLCTLHPGTTADEAYSPSPGN